MPQSRVTLSFDNGPTPGITDHVLDVLKEHGVRATFFVVGEKLRSPEARALVQRAHAEGHWIGGHSMTHGLPLGDRSEPDVAEREIGDVNRLLGDLAHKDRLFRPNGRAKVGQHLLSELARDYLIENRGTLVLWTHIPRDRGVPPDLWVTDAQLASSETEWPLLVLHDRPSGHDLPAGSMTFLNRYLKWARDADIKIVQDIPDSCIPIRRGEVRMSLHPYVTPAKVE